jgi:antitoxin PrlF
VEYHLEFISTKISHTPTMTGTSGSFPRGYGRGLFLFNEDESIRYYAENLSYEDLLDAIELNLIDESLQVLSTVVEPPSIIWDYERKYDVYKRVIVVDPRLPKECLGDYEEKILNIISKDIDEHPENLVPVSNEMWNHIKELTDGVEVNLDNPIEDDDES